MKIPYFSSGHDAWKLLGRPARAPLLQFLVIGAALFAWDARVSSSSKLSENEARQIVVTEQHLEQMAERFARTWNRRPTASEKKALMKSWIEDEVWVREALDLSLEENDTVIRNRLVQKMKFLTDSVLAAEIVPTEKELTQFIDERRTEYMTPARVTFEHVCLADDDLQGMAARKALAAGKKSVTLGSPSILPTSMDRAIAKNVDALFGMGFFQILSAVETAKWSGPYASGYGHHLVRVLHFEKARLPELSEIQTRVENDWRAQLIAKRSDRFVDQMRAKYTIVTPDVQKPGVQIP